MNHREISQIFFKETYTVPVEQKAGPTMFSRLPYTDRIIDAMSSGYLVAVLESICAREMQPHLDHYEEMVVGSSVQCQHYAPIAYGALITIDGWVIGIGDHEATFRVRASDEQEIVCEGHIRFAMVWRAQVEKKLQHKREAIKRRELFAAA